jgi:hypothetical protein
MYVRDKYDRTFSIRDAQDYSSYSSMSRSCAACKRCKPEQQLCDSPYLYWPSLSPLQGCNRNFTHYSGFALCSQESIFTGYASFQRFHRNALEFLRSGEPGLLPYTMKRNYIRLHPYHQHSIPSTNGCSWDVSYSSMWTQMPAPTVRPPSRMANFTPSSMATGWINSTVIVM